MFCLSMFCHGPLLFIDWLLVGNGRRGGVGGQMSMVCIWGANVLHPFYSVGQMSTPVKWGLGGNVLMPFVMGGQMSGVAFVRTPEQALYEGCSGSSWNLVIKCSNINILHSYFEILQVDIIELAPIANNKIFFTRTKI